FEEWYYSRADSCAHPEKTYTACATIVSSETMADLIPTAEEIQPTSSPTPSPSGESRIAGVFRSLKHRNFRLFFSGQLISLVGTWMQTIAEAWLIYRLTGSSVLLGLLGFVSQIPIFLLSPIAGL